MAADSLVDPGIADGLFDRSVNHRVVEMVSANDSGSGIGPAGARREDILPSPIDCGLGVFTGEGGRHVDAAETIGQILLMEVPDPVEVVLEALSAGAWQQGYSVFATLAVTDRDCAESEVDILDAEPEALEDPHPSAIEQHDDELDGAFEAGKEGAHLLSAEDGGKSLRLAGADDVVDPRGIEFEDFAVEEEDGAEGLPVGRGGDVVVDGEVGDDVHGVNKT